MRHMRLVQYVRRRPCGGVVQVRSRRCPLRRVRLRRWRCSSHCADHLVRCCSYGCRGAGAPSMRCVRRSVCVQRLQRLLQRGRGVRRFHD